MFCCIFGWYFYIEIRLKNEKDILLSSSRAFSLFTPIENSAVWQHLSFFIVNSEATWKSLKNATNILNCKMRILERFSHIVEREAACWRKCPLNQLWQHRHRLSTRQCGLSKNKVRLVVEIPHFSKRTSHLLQR